MAPQLRATWHSDIVPLHTYAGVGNNKKQAYIKQHDPGAMLVDMAALQGPGQALKPGLIGIMSSLLHILTALATIIAVSQLSSFCSCEIGAEYDIDATFDLSSTSTGTSTANGGREMGASTSTLSGISQYNGQEGQEDITAYCPGSRIHLCRIYVSYASLTTLCTLHVELGSVVALTSLRIEQ
eukprot:jgi/Mesvir1/3421/Mv24215-RA.1